MAKYLICYDISEPKRLIKVCKYLKGIGLHAQYSMFICDLTESGLEKTVNVLKSLVNPAEDDLRIYPLPARLRIFMMGKGYKKPEGIFFR